jgi:uncharacterized protein YjbI with pentapeptide repeats
MTDSDRPENKDLDPESGQGLATRTHLSPRSDLTYRMLTNLDIVQEDAYQSLFTGSLISCSSFKQTRFSVSDLDGVRAENTVFSKCDFTICDIRSCTFTKCSFIDCKFDNSYIDDCKFLHCELSACTFVNAAFTNSIYQDSTLARCSIKHATFLHNRLYNSQLDDMVLGNCTLLYIIFRDCRLHNISINAESIGAIFGLDRSQLESCQLVYLGKLQHIPGGIDIVDSLYEQYRKRQWYIGQLTLSLNYRNKATLHAFRDYLRASKSHFLRLGFTKGDELKFLAALLDELAVRNELPFLTVIELLEWCSSLESLLNSRNPNSAELPETSISSLASHSIILSNDMLDKLNTVLMWPDKTSSDVPLDLKATFAVEPSVKCADVLNIIRTASSLRIKESTSLIRSYSGSYIEIIHTTLYTVCAFRLFLFLINGCVIQVTELKERLNILGRKRLPKTYTELALSGKQQPFAGMLQELRSLAGLSKMMPFLQENNLGGFEDANIKSLSIQKMKGQ